MTWQPIETAPKDGAEILAFRSDAGVLMVRWAWMGDVVPRDINGDPYEDYDEDYYGWWHDAFGWQENSDVPTHWMPLPAPPQQDSNP